MKTKLFDEAIKLAFLEGFRAFNREPGRQEEDAYNLWKMAIEEKLAQNTTLQTQPLAVIYTAYQQCSETECEEFQPGDKVHYFSAEKVPDNTLLLPATVVGMVGNWVELKFIDNSTAIVRIKNVKRRSETIT